MRQASVVLQPSEQPTGIMAFELGSDGSGLEYLYVPAAGSVMPLNLNAEKAIKEKLMFIKMNGTEVFKFATRTIGASMKRVLDKAGMLPEDVVLYIPHQANARIIKSAARMMRQPLAKFYMNIHKYGNTSAASVPLALVEALEDGSCKMGDKIVLCAFGAGLTWATAVYQLGVAQDEQAEGAALAEKARFFAKRTVNRVQDMAQNVILQMQMRRYDAQRKAKAKEKENEEICPGATGGYRSSAHSRESARKLEPVIDFGGLALTPTPLPTPLRGWERGRALLKGCAPPTPKQGSATVWGISRGLPSQTAPFRTVPSLEHLFRPSLSASSPSQHKAAGSSKLVNRLSILPNRPMNTATEPFSLYLHIPFCGTRCTYCAFNTYTGVDSLIPDYVEALGHEVRLLGPVTGAPLHTIYFGGGTPSLLTPDQVRTILDTCRTAFVVTHDAEITLEANPGTLQPGYLAAIRECGVNRLSLGMQSALAGELQMMQRDHTAAEVPMAVEAARRAGFDNLSLDLIFALPFQTLEGWLKSVRAALALEPDHLSMYALELEPGTAMTVNVERGRLPLPDEDLAAAMYESADRLVGAAGLAQYEISNWARPGYECRHNLQYWHYGPYLGVGAGAHGFAAGIRYAAVKGIKTYIERVRDGAQGLAFPLTSSADNHEHIDAHTARMEYLFTGLRLTQCGISREAFAARFGMRVEDAYGPALRRLTAAGLLVSNGDRLKLTPQARLVSNQVFRALV